MTLRHSCIHLVVIGISGLRFLNEVKCISSWHDNSDSASNNLLAVWVPGGFLQGRFFFIPHFTKITFFIVRISFQRFCSLLYFLNLPSKSSVLIFVSISLVFRDVLIFAVARFNIKYESTPSVNNFFCQVYYLRHTRHVSCVKFNYSAQVFVCLQIFRTNIKKVNCA